MIRRKNNSKGETFVETLVALIIAVLALLMLPVSLVVSTRINNKIATSEKLRTVEARPEAATVHETQVKEEVTVTELSGYKVKVDSTDVSGVTIYQDTAGYVFFDYEPETSAAGGGPGGE